MSTDQPAHRRARQKQRQRLAPAGLDAASADLTSLTGREHALWRTWASGSSQTRTWQTLLRHAGPAGIEDADRLREWLMNQGWLIVNEKFERGTWFCQSITWTRLPAMQALLGLTTDADRQANAEAQRQHMLAWLDRHADQSVHPEGFHGAVQDLLKPGVPADRRAQRMALIEAAHDWSSKGTKGTRQDFALHARQGTKFITATEWAWLDQHIGLEALAIEGFISQISLAGPLRLQWAHQSFDLSAVTFATLPTDDVAGATSATIASGRSYWLVENRASFERAAQRRGAGDVIVWMPGRPTRSWLATVGRLLDLAPAPGKISADIDPAGVAIAMEAASPWLERGLPWQPHLMTTEILLTCRQQWPLGPHDRRLLASLAQRDDLPATLSTLCEAMADTGRKAEQEGWI